MGNITKMQQQELIKILEELIETINKMRAIVSDYVLGQNEREAKEWLKFMKEHVASEELKSLEDEISNRFFYKFDVKISDSELDDKRCSLMKDFIMKSSEYRKMLL